MESKVKFPSIFCRQQRLDSHSPQWNCFEFECVVNLSVDYKVVVEYFRKSIETITSTTIPPIKISLPNDRNDNDQFTSYTEIEDIEDILENSNAELSLVVNTNSDKGRFLVR